MKRVFVERGAVCVYFGTVLHTDKLQLTAAFARELSDELERAANELDPLVRVDVLVADEEAAS